MKRHSFYLLTFCTTIAFLLLISLGLWQMERLAWKQSILQKIEGNKKVTRDINAINGDIDGFEFATIQARGVFLLDKTFKMPGKVYKGQMGSYLITPLKLANNKIVLVNRGWVPNDFARGGGTPFSQRVRGMLRLAKRPNTFTPDNQPDKNQWYWVDVPAMAAAQHLDNVAPYYLAALRGEGDTFPQGFPDTIEIPNNHLQYALTWFLLAGVLVVVYLVMVMPSCTNKIKNKKKK